MVSRSLAHGDPVFAFRLGSVPLECSHHTNGKGQLSGLHNGTVQPPLLLKSILMCTVLLVNQSIVCWHFPFVISRKVMERKLAWLSSYLIHRLLPAKWFINMVYCGLVPFYCVLFLDRTMLHPTPFIFFFLVWVLYCLGMKGKCLLLLAKHLPCRQPNHRS